MPTGTEKRACLIGFRELFVSCAAPVINGFRYKIERFVRRLRFVAFGPNDARMSVTNRRASAIKRDQNRGRFNFLTCGLINPGRIVNFELWC